MTIVSRSPRSRSPEDFAGCPGAPACCDANVVPDITPPEGMARWCRSVRLPGGFTSLPAKRRGGIGCDLNLLPPSWYLRDSHGPVPVFSPAPTCPPGRVCEPESLGCKTLPWLCRRWARGSAWGALARPPSHRRSSPPKGSAEAAPRPAHPLSPGFWGQREPHTLPGAAGARQSHPAHAEGCEMPAGPRRDGTEERDSVKGRRIGTRRRWRR